MSSSAPVFGDSLHSVKFWQSKSMTMNWTKDHAYDRQEILGSFPAFDYEVNVPITEEIYGQRMWLFSAVYVASLFSGMKLMEKRAPIVLKPLLVAWNLGLAVMSLLGAWRTVPEAFAVVSRHGLYPSVCISTFLFENEVTAFWSLVFTVSKLAEFGDTFFLVVRKRPVIFLHWYHHISVMFFSYYCYYNAVAVARWFMVLNFAVHSVMYSYYLARSLSIRVPKFVSMAITVVQISQMVTASLLISAALNFRNSGLPCSVTATEATIFLSIYASYFVLFAKFFYDSYLLRPTPTQTSGKTTGKRTSKLRVD